MRAVGTWARFAVAGIALAVALGMGGCAAPSAGLQGRLETAPGKKTRTAVENTVVYLVSDKPESAVAAPAPATATVSVDGSGIHPAVLAISSGTRVEFRNKDAMFHKVFSISPTQPFDVGALGPGDEHTIVFEHAGVIHVFCELHPNESAYIYVTPTPWFTRMDAHGRFHLAGVTPGAYTLRTWHPERGETSQAVVVPRHGELAVTITD